MHLTVLIAKTCLDKNDPKIKEAEPLIKSPLLEVVGNFFIPDF
jgi:hypothetical protein